MPKIKKLELLQKNLEKERQQLYVQQKEFQDGCDKKNREFEQRELDIETRELASAETIQKNNELSALALQTHFNELDIDRESLGREIEKFESQKDEWRKSEQTKLRAEIVNYEIEKKKYKLECDKTLRQEIDKLDTLKRQLASEKFELETLTQELDSREKNINKLLLEHKTKSRDLAIKTRESSIWIDSEKKMIEEIRKSVQKIKKETYSEILKEQTRIINIIDSIIDSDGIITEIDLRNIKESMKHVSDKLETENGL
jgi:chromosome segregation ATPase